MEPLAGQAGQADARDELWKLYQDNIAQGRHHETQRSTVIGLVLAVATALLGIATFDKEISLPLDAVIAAALIGLGIFGAGFSMKHYERFELHMARARGYRNALDQLLPDQPLLTIKAAADKAHKRKYPRLHKLRLRTWWVGLNLAISALGLGLLAVSIWFPISPAIPGQSAEVVTRMPSG